MPSSGCGSQSVTRASRCIGEAGAPVCHQLTTRDYAKSFDFYGEVFGWQIETISDSDEFRYSTAIFDGEHCSESWTGLGSARGDDINWYFFLGSDDVDKTLALSRTTAERTARRRGHALWAAGRCRRPHRGGFQPVFGGSVLTSACWAPLPLAQRVQQFAVRADQIGGVAGAQPGVAARMQLTGSPPRAIAMTRVCVDMSTIRIPSSSLPVSTCTPPTMNERWPTENVPSTCRPIAAPMNHGAASSTVERTFSKPKRCATAAPSARSYTRSTTGRPGGRAGCITRTSKHLAQHDAGLDVDHVVAGQHRDRAGFVDAGRLQGLAQRGVAEDHRHVQFGGRDR